MLRGLQSVDSFSHSPNCGTACPNNLFLLPCSHTIPDLRIYAEPTTNCKLIHLMKTSSLDKFTGLLTHKRLNGK